MQLVVLPVGAVRGDPLIAHGADIGSSIDHTGTQRSTAVAAMPLITSARMSQGMTNLTAGIISASRMAEAEPGGFSSRTGIIVVQALRYGRVASAGAIGACWRLGHHRFCWTREKEEEGQDPLRLDLLRRPRRRAGRGGGGDHCPDGVLRPAFAGSAAIPCAPPDEESSRVHAVARSRPAGSEPALAVLPLENFSGDAQQDYFADGMTEAIIADLATVKGLRVISRTSSMAYKRSPEGDCRRSRRNWASISSSKGRW